MQDRKSNFYSQLGMVERLEEYWGDITCVHTMLESFEYEYMGVKFDQHHRLHMGWCAVLSKLGIEWDFSTPPPGSKSLWLPKIQCPDKSYGVYLYVLNDYDMWYDSFLLWATDECKCEEIKMYMVGEFLANFTDSRIPVYIKENGNYETGYHLIQCPYCNNWQLGIIGNNKLLCGHVVKRSEDMTELKDKFSEAITFGSKNMVSYDKAFKDHYIKSLVTDVYDNHIITEKINKMGESYIASDEYFQDCKDMFANQLSENFLASHEEGFLTPNAIKFGGYNSYQEYLQSDHWKQFAADAKERAGNRCQLCNSDGELHTHHRTYDRLGEELPEDVVVLCADCHAKFHDK